MTGTEFLLVGGPAAGRIVIVRPTGLRIPLTPGAAERFRNEPIDDRLTDVVTYTYWPHQFGAGRNLYRLATSIERPAIGDLQAAAVAVLSLTPTDQARVRGAR